MNVKILTNARLRKINLSTFGPLIAFILVYGFFAILNAKILSLTAIETIIQQTVIVGIGAIGMTFVIISGGIDLSVGSIIADGIRSSSIFDANIWTGSISCSNRRHLYRFIMGLY